MGTRRKQETPGREDPFLVNLVKLEDALQEFESALELFKRAVLSRDRAEAARLSRNLCAKLKALAASVPAVEE